jgi:hypothetical protein
MRFFCFLILFTLSTLYSFSQKVSGLVTGKDGKPVQFASVFIKGTSIGTNANAEGKYFLELKPGQYTLVCQQVNYKKQEKPIVCTREDMIVDFVLDTQVVTLIEVIVRPGPDPAYEIMDSTIRKRKYHLAQLDKFQCEVYTKGQLRVRSYPNKILGRKVDFEDGDTSKKKMLYLSETISLYSVEKPDKERIEVISSKVSGSSDAYGLSAPRFFSFYDNNIFIGNEQNPNNTLNPRGFISPISDNALNYYKYKFEGDFQEDDKTISRIKVIPRRKFEPLFEGYINIVYGEWRLHSVQLKLTKESQMQFLDSLKIEQLYRPVNGDTWAIMSQVMYPWVKIFGFDAYGSFVNIYSNFDLEPNFEKKHFNNTFLKYNDGSNKKNDEYWESARPVPLQEDEIFDYRVKDSLEQVRLSPAYLDSIEKVRNQLNLFGAMMFEQTYVTTSKRITFNFRPFTEQINFNPAEGLVINPAATWTKRLDSSRYSRRSISFSPSVRFGFANKHFNGHLTVRYNYGKRNANQIALSGGKRVFQFNNYSPIGPRGNTLSCLLGKENRMKTYEAYYFRGSFTESIGAGFTWIAGFQYQDRMPLNNVTNYSWFKKDEFYTPNYPFELVNENIQRHQVLLGLLRLNWQPNTRYIELPEQRINIGSKSPTFSLEYIHGFKNILGSDADFSKWKFSIRDELNLRLKGNFSYRLGVGGFLNNKFVPLPDYQHFNGNISSFATERVNSFQLLPLYQFSNTKNFYALGHAEHNFNGLLTNKIPGIKRLNIYLVVGANAFYINRDTNYVEYFFGIDNIFKQFRIDFVQSYANGKKWMFDFRIGFRRTYRPRGDDWP